MNKAEKKELKKRAKLAEAAGIDIYAFNTGVVFSEDKTFRLSVKSGFENYRDMVAVQIMYESEPGMWRSSHITPANARILAYHLNRKADLAEGN